MKSAERALPFENREELQELLGLYDRNLRAIRKAASVEVVVRNGSLSIRGEPEGVDRAHEAFSKLQACLRHQGEITEGDLEEVLQPLPSAADRRAAAPVPGKIFRPAEHVGSKSDGQRQYLHELETNEIVFAIGPAGTGKTFLAVSKAVDALRGGQVRRIVLVRPAVEAGERLGFLPGDIQEKVNPYLRPIYDSLNTFLEFGQLKRLIETDVVEICPLAYMRGRTLDEAVIILDEAQNTTGDQMKMFLTRMGTKSRIVVTGDITQIDLPPGKVSGLVEVQDLLKGIPGVSFVYLTREDIVRHPLVQRIVDAYDRRRGRK